MKLRVALLVSLGALALGSSSCLKADSMKARNSGQSRLMEETFAGKNACNPDNHLRPFIIEWDATDMSSFESHAANDIVIVRYEGCSLQVLGECKNDSIRGSQGAYKPPEWTSGSLESIDISNEGELYAKLPLGAASLGGRVSGGERFHMEYYVAGTRNATRDSVYTADLADNPGCEGATHFVYGYNLGAFALGSANELNTKVGGSVYGFGAGGSTSSKRNAEKKGGDLVTCKSDSATEVQGCKAPIRLTLREIREGENPDVAAMEAPDTPESLNAAGIVNMKVEMSDQARAHLESATQKANARDGKACLAELDIHAKLDPKHASTDPKSGFAQVRAQCLMLAGKCKAGKSLARKAFENTAVAQWGPEQIDKTVEAYGSMYCQGEMGPREAVLQSLMELQKGAYTTKKDTKFCEKHYKRIKKLQGKVKPKDDDDHQIVNLKHGLYGTVPACFGRAGNCKRAWSAFKELSMDLHGENYKDLPKEQIEEILRSTFESTVRKCKGEGK